MNLPRKDREIIDRYSVYVADARIVKAPVVSVLMWTYNDAAYIRQSVDSVLMQEADFEYELVISDDCSTDGTTEILQAYQRQHPDKIRLILSKENLWTRNVIEQRLLYQGRGKYIALTHGDDYWTDPRKLQKQVDLLEARQSASAVFHDILEEDCLSGLKQPWRSFAFVDGACEYGLQNTISASVLCHTSSLMFRSQMVVSWPAWIYSCTSGDMAMYFMCGLHGSLLRIPEFMGVYRHNAAGVTKGGMHSGCPLHYHRLKMLTHFRRHLGKRAIEFDWRCLSQHVDGIIGHQGLRHQLPNLVRAIQEAPRLVFHPFLFRLFIQKTFKRQPAYVSQVPLVRKSR